jgi:multiple sugar transport system permease protein/raffinose/stachyose/melibiose transport system permease protein
MLTVYPIVFMLANALKTGIQTTDNAFSLPLHPVWNNFVLAWQAIAPAFGRTVVVVGVSVTVILACSLLSGYVFARLNFRERDTLFYIIFALLLVPSFLTLIPLFLEIKNFGLLNSIWGLVLPYIAGGQAFCIFVLRTFIRGIPDELFEAARIYGASDIQMFLRLVVPLSVPIVVTLALLSIVGLWGDYVLPSLILQTQSRETLALAIVNFQPPAQTLSLNAFNQQLAAFTLASIPIALLFVFLLRYFISGITNGALKM